MSPKASTLLASLAGAALVAAHGHVSHIIVNGVYYRNYDPTTDFYNPSAAPKVLGWSALNQDNGFIEPVNFGTSDIICHKGSAPGAAHVTVAAGDSISVVWTPEWPESHVGPVIDYLANCNGDCETVDKTALRFFKIGASGYDNGWAADKLKANGNSWIVKIPSDLAAGSYVLRHEIIALHGGPNPNGAQAYPQCFNLRITGSGSLSPAGVAGTSLYTATDPGILFQTYQSPVVYPIPGPALIAGASSVVQSTSKITATGTATLPGGSGSNPTTVATSSTRAATTTSAAVPTTSSVRTTLSTSTTSSAPVQTGTAQAKWGQCGGNGWTGPTTCVAGSTCVVLNPWYSQCV